MKTSGQCMLYLILSQVVNMGGMKSTIIRPDTSGLLVHYLHECSLMININTRLQEAIRLAKNKHLIEARLQLRILLKQRTP